ncbi:PUF3 [Candida jiufengensis]|uniref:PUF3 n=1 Tax=Candida jiufengensis TaxID=497108 RepID=UPI002225B303|nr:PUF3 [Candida jiufengensis]KAI5954926.1 PUF3 [Candida jiufengensis]
MPTETIWSSANTSPITTQPSLTPLTNNSNLNSNSTTYGSKTQFKSVLDQVDPEVAKFLQNTNPLESLTSQNNERRFSFNDGSDIDDNSFFGFKRGTLSAITAPVGNYNNNNNQLNGNKNNSPLNNGNQRINFGTASISGGIASRHPPQESFLQKFSNVADATREIEFGKLKLDDNQHNSRRTSFNNEFSGELNMPAPRSTSRHQSISEKIDNYNNNSPIQTNAALSINSDLNSSENLNILHQNNQQNNTINGAQNFWNPAAATSFTPATNYFMDNNGFPIPTPPPSHQMQNFYNRQGAPIPPISPPPFMIPSPPPPQFMDPSIYSMMYGNLPPFPPPPPQSQSQQDDRKSHVDEDDKKSNEIKASGSGPIGVGLMNRQFSPASFMFHPFNPYYQQGPLTPDILKTMSPPPPPQMMVPPPQQPQQPPQQQQQQQSQSAPKQPSKSTSPPPKDSKKKSKTKNTFIYRSPLLEEVRSNTKNFKLGDIYGHAIEFTKDQYGSRFIQQKLPEATEVEKEMVFNEIRDISYELMTDVFGNYVIQKYFEYGSTTQKQILLEKMIGHIYELSLQMYGCRVVQRALESLEQTDDQLKIINELRDYILICSKDQNANHVIQKAIEMIKPFDKIKFILEALTNHIYNLTTDAYGCRIIQRLLKSSNPNDQVKIIDELNSYIYYIIQDSYGNYVVQYMLENGSSQEKNKILDIILEGDNLLIFSKHKFASNVIEKAIKYGDLKQRKKILNKVMESPTENLEEQTIIILMLKDQYANYVIQKLIEYLEENEDKQRLISKLKNYLQQSSKNGNQVGGKQLASVEKLKSLIGQ